MTLVMEQAAVGRNMPYPNTAIGEAESDDELASRSAAGDAKAFQLLVDRHLPRILGLTRRMLGDDAEAEDVAQEAMLRLWRHAGDYDPTRAKLSTWLYRVASNLSIDKLRGRKFAPLEDAPEQEVSASQEKGILEEQLSQRVDVAMQGLPERQRLALVLFHYQELSMAETAEMLDCSVEAVESLLGRARRSLKKELENEWRAFMPDGAG